MEPKKKNIYSVSQINSYIRGMFAQDFLMNGLMLRGEISNLTDHRSGHLYFTLKDEKSSISAVMFAGSRQRGLNFRPKEGMQVIATGEISVYEAAGKYQLYVRKLEPDGAGLLAQRFEELKQKLQEQGMFDQAYKRPIPPYVRTLGIVTAPTGAAVRDIIQISKRRNPYLQIILYPALVQGEGAAQSIVQGIRALEALGVDVIIAGRGGGSLEDLWAFNEEMVAEAFFQCGVPIISAVGHETDVVLSDFVADLRAPTPSAAAELAVCEIRDLLETIRGDAERLKAQMEAGLSRFRLQTENLSLRLKTKEPMNRLRAERLRLTSLEESLTGRLSHRLEREKDRPPRYESELKGKMEAVLEKQRHRLALFSGSLSARSPLERLSGGYVYARTKEGKGVRSVSQVEKGDRLEIFLRDGKLKAEVAEKEELAGSLSPERRQDGE